MKLQLNHGDCLDVLRGMADNSIDSIVTDPPYGLSFMGKKWDYDVPAVEVWAECLRVLKPGGHLLAFAGTRTQHRMAVRIEDAGFEIRDMIAWVYGSGFPKSLDVSKAIDKAAGAARDVIGSMPDRWTGKGNALNFSTDRPQTSIPVTGAPATEAARQWQGWGTALKPALEPITMARKPFASTVAANVLVHGTGALNIDGCRVEANDGANRARPPRSIGGSAGDWKDWIGRESEHNTVGRWPANLIHDDSDEVVAGFPATAASKAGGTSSRGDESTWSPSKGMNTPGRTVPRTGHNDSGGSAARFFYSPKASKRDRDEGLEHLDLLGPGRTCYDSNYHEGGGKLPPRTGNHHPTVKPTELMRYLCRLVTPPGGVVLDPFMGSGSTGKAATLEGFGFIGIEREAEYVEIARARIEAVQLPLELAA